MKVTMELQGWPAGAVDFEGRRRVVVEEMGKALAEADALLLREVQDRTPDNVIGHLRDSMFSREVPTPTGGLGVVGTAKPYAVYVELGTRPHFPPLQPLADWARAKLGVSEQEAEGVALAIARKIAVRGTLGVGMFHRAWAACAPQVERIFAAARDRIAARLAGA